MIVPPFVRTAHHIFGYALNSITLTLLCGCLSWSTFSDDVSAAGDWPMWRYDAGRTAASPHELPERLTLDWVRHEKPRQQVWDDPLNHDLMQYDKIFEPIIVDGLVIVGYNDSDKVVAWDINTGSEVWAAYTEGPVRLPPAAWRDRLFVTSDDGYLYCFQVATGELMWKFRGGPSDRKVLGNRRVINMWPARGGAVVRDDRLYFAASIWPFLGTFLYELDAETGEIQWVNDGTGAQYIKQPHGAPSFGGVAPQGALVVTEDRVIVPGGRSVPAVFDRDNGELKYYRINDGGKGTGGSFVAADEENIFVHTRRRRVRRFDLSDGKKHDQEFREPVLAEDRVYVGKYDKLVQSRDAKDKDIVQWELQVDGSGDIIQAGNRVYAAGKETLTAIQPAADGESATVAWQLPVDGEIMRLLAGSDHLVGVTSDGRIMAFGIAPDEQEAVKLAGQEGGAGQENGADSETSEEANAEEVDESKGAAASDSEAPSAAATTIAVHNHRWKPVELPQPSDQAVEFAKGIGEQVKSQAGYVLMYGIDPERIDALLTETEFHVVGVGTDEKQIADLRTRYDQAGFYGNRLALHVAEPDRFYAPQYIAHAVIVHASLATTELLPTLYESVRPYGGVLCVAKGDGLDMNKLKRLTKEAKLAKAAFDDDDRAMYVVRTGALEDSASWTHVYGNIANTVKSDDKRIKMPLGILWFGGASNTDVLPRHGHGPPEQVLGGRLFIQGNNTMSARDVYTGRLLWRRMFEDLGTYDVYFDDTYKNEPLNPAYNQVHIPGANMRGTNYVVTEDTLYLVVDNRCLLIDPVTGEDKKEIELPKTEDDERPEAWAFIGIYKDILLAGVDFGDFSERIDGVKDKGKAEKRKAWSVDRMASLGLMALDRKSGKKLWEAKAKYGFLHNGIVAGDDRVYCLDKLPESVEKQIERRGRDKPNDYQIVAFEAKSGKVAWKRKAGISGTWLSYSDEHKVLLHAGSEAPDRSEDEVGQGMLVLKAKDGETVWEAKKLKYSGPCILHNDRIITNSRSYGVTSGVFELMTGKKVMVDNPVTGKTQPWVYKRAYGCNTAVACENLLTFRSGAAGYYDLVSKTGTGNLGGFRSGCSSNLIAADGVLNAPDYTRTCSCGYQNQTSLGLIHMPDVETWAVSPLTNLDTEQRILHVGVNMGAPGDRRDKDGTLWLEAPNESGDNPAVQVDIRGDDLRYYRRHVSAVTDGNLPWVAASGVENVERVVLRLRAIPDEKKDRKKDKGKKKKTEAKKPSDPLVEEQFAEGATYRYNVRFYFCEPDNIGAGKRVFDVAVRGRTVLEGLDITKEAEGRWKELNRQVNTIGSEVMVFDFEKQEDSEHGPILSGIEIIRK